MQSFTLLIMALCYACIHTAVVALLKLLNCLACKKSRMDSSKFFGLCASSLLVLSTDSQMRFATISPYCTPLGSLFHCGFVSETSKQVRFKYTRCCIPNWNLGLKDKKQIDVWVGRWDNGRYKTLRRALCEPSVTFIHIWTSLMKPSKCPHSCLRKPDEPDLAAL